MTDMTNEIHGTIPEGDCPHCGGPVEVEDSWDYGLHCWCAACGAEFAEDTVAVRSREGDR